MDMQLEQKRIAVLGNGAWGTALAIALARNGHLVSIWGMNEEELLPMRRSRVNSLYLPGVALEDGIDICLDLGCALREVHRVIIAMPSHIFHIVLEKLQTYFNAAMAILIATKGLDHKNRLLHEAAYESFGGDVLLSFMAGPSFAAEVARSMLTSIMIVSAYEACALDWQRLFSSRELIVEVGVDIIGAEIASATKNVIAVAVGMIDGVGYGSNAKASLITQGLKEMAALVAVMGGNSATVWGLAGVGDLMLTCTDDQSRNRSFGMEVGRGAIASDILVSAKHVVEGARNAKIIYDLSKRYGVDMPIIEQVYQAIYENKPIAEAIACMFSLKSTS